MSSLAGKLCAFILKEHFGENVEKTGKILFACGQSPFRLMSFKSGDLDRKTVSAIILRYDCSDAGCLCSVFTGIR